MIKSLVMEELEKSRKMSENNTTAQAQLEGRGKFRLGRSYVLYNINFENAIQFSNTSLRAQLHFKLIIAAFYVH